jgi:Ca2+/H+ antiporter
MIVCNGIVGACLLWGGVRHREQGFQAQGAGAALAVLVALTSLTMVLPNLAAQELGPLYNTSQLVFAALASWFCTWLSSSFRRSGTVTISLPRRGRHPTSIRLLRTTGRPV